MREFHINAVMDKRCQMLLPFYIIDILVVEKDIYPVKLKPRKP